MATEINASNTMGWSHYFLVDILREKSNTTYIFGSSLTVFIPLLQFPQLSQSASN
jgi:hypothetical protein